MKSNSEKKEFINMAGLAEELQRRNNRDVPTEKAVREKILELFDVLGIKTELLQENRKVSGEYKFPVEYIDFMVWLYEFYTSPDGKLLRKGDVEKIEPRKIRYIIDNTYLMLVRSGVSKEEADEQIQRTAQYLDFMCTEVKNEIKEVLNEIMLDVFPIEDKFLPLPTEELLHGKIRRGRFRYDKDILRNRDLYVFLQFVKEELVQLRNKHHMIYGYMKDIRAEEIDQSAYRVGNTLSDEEEDLINEGVNQGTILFEFLLKDSEYVSLLKKEHEMYNSDQFLKQRKKEIEKIKKRMLEIEQKYTEKYFGGELIDVDDLLIDPEMDEKDPITVLSMAKEEYQEYIKLKKSLACKSFLKRLFMDDDEAMGNDELIPEDDPDEINYAKKKQSTDKSDDK